MALSPRAQTALFVLTDNDGRQYGIDVTMRQRFSDRFIVTKHPVEEGAEVADHIQKSEAIIEITGEITNTPLHLTEEADPRRAVTSYELLRRVADQRRTVALATPVRSYEQLAFTELSVERGSDISSEVVRVTMTLIEIIRAKTLLTTLDPSLFAPDVADSAARFAGALQGAIRSTRIRVCRDLDGNRTILSEAVAAQALRAEGDPEATVAEFDQCRLELAPRRDLKPEEEQGVQNALRDNGAPYYVHERIRFLRGAPLDNIDGRIDWTETVNRGQNAVSAQRD